jgi:hypothetical protein
MAMGNSLSLVVSDKPRLPKKNKFQWAIKKTSTYFQTIYIAI